MSAIWLFSFEVRLRRKKTKTTSLEVLKSSSLRQCISRLPQWSSGKNSPAKAKDTGLITGPGRSCMPWNNWAHAPQLLKLCATTTEARAPWNLSSAPREATVTRIPSTLEAVLCTKRSHRNENPEHPEEAHSPHLPQLENACTQQQRHNTAKNK